MKKTIFCFATLTAALVLFAACSNDDNSGDDGVKTYAVGDLYNEAGVKGVVYKLDDASNKHGMIISLDEAKLAWATASVASTATGATDEESGAKNMEAVMKLSNWKVDYPAFAWCDAKNTAGIKGWVFPAKEQIDELYEVYEQSKAVINKTLSDNGGMPLQTTEAESWYWASTEHFLVNDVNTAAAIRFVDLTAAYALKTTQYRVRAVRAF